jgi:hypothetical protein
MAADHRKIEKSAGQSRMYEIKLAEITSAVCR